MPLGFIQFDIPNCHTKLLYNISIDSNNSKKLKNLELKYYVGNTIKIGYYQVFFNIPTFFRHLILKLTTLEDQWISLLRILKYQGKILMIYSN